MVVNIGPLVQAFTELITAAMNVPDTWAFQVGDVSITVLDIALLFIVVPVTIDFLDDIME